MAHYAVIENGHVVNTVESDAEHALQNGWVAAEKEVCIGWAYENGVFTDTRIFPEPEIQTAPTKEQLMAELAALTAKIQALE